MKETIKVIMKGYKFPEGVNYEAMAKHILRQWIQEKDPSISTDEFLKNWESARTEIQLEKYFK